MHKQEDQSFLPNNHNLETQQLENNSEKLSPQIFLALNAFRGVSTKATLTDKRSVPFKTIPTSKRFT